MKPYEIINGDCRTAMQLIIEPCSVDSIVTDPPYELGFMGKGWDSTGIANDLATWRAAFECLKPGGHLLAFSGSRTYHRMVCAIEDAGFEIRDQIMWVYGSGFPKSLDVSKAIDKAAGAERDAVATRRVAIDRWTAEGRRRLEAGETGHYEVATTAPATEDARQWQGWGTALKPAHEPIVMARKPLIGTVAANVLAHGTGGLNIDGCRVKCDDVLIAPKSDPSKRVGVVGSEWQARSDVLRNQTAQAASIARTMELGRWPANLIHDGSDEVLAAFPQAPGQSGAVTGNEPTGNGFSGVVYGYGGKAKRPASTPRGDVGSAARFFYCAKASKADRGADNTHPTVKPAELMRYLCRLVTPPGGLILDPFTGSGSTGKAAVLEGFRFIGCEMSDEYVAIAEARIAAAYASVLKAAA